MFRKTEVWLVLPERTMALCGGYWKSLQGMEYGGCLPQSVSLVLSWVHSSQNVHTLNMQGVGRVVKHWNTLQESPSLDVLKKCVTVESDAVES